VVKSKEQEIKDQIIDLLIQNEKLRYSELRKKITLAKSERTFQKHLKDLVKIGTVVRIENNSAVEYTLAGITKESTVKILNQKNKQLQELEIKFNKIIKSYNSSTKKKTLLSDYNVSKKFFELFRLLFDLNQLIFYFEFTKNPLLHKKTKIIYRNHYDNLQKTLKSLENSNKGIFFHIMHLLEVKNYNQIRISDFIHQPRVEHNLRHTTIYI